MWRNSRLALSVVLTGALVFAGSVSALVPLSIPVLLKDINTLPASTGPSNAVTIGGITFFTAAHPEFGIELWRTDGTSTGTFVIEDIWPGGSSSAPFALTNVNGVLFFRANDGVTGVELWKSDGTEPGTVLVKDIFPGDGSSASLTTGELTNVNGVLFFNADDDNNGDELWRSDGTAAGTTLVKDILSGANGSTPRSLRNVNGTLFLIANDGVVGSELWKSDGTAAGTIRVRDITPGPSSVAIGSLTNLNGTLIFTVFDGTIGNELWRSDGTDAGTVLIKDIFPGPSGSLPAALLVHNGTLFFAANDGTNGTELWRSNGTASGTELFKDIMPGSGSSFPTSLASVSGTLFFNASDAEGGELWKSDGTPAGTVRVKDIRPGSSGSNPQGLTNFNGTLLFTADDGNTGRELWRSDGTGAGTTLVEDISLGANSSSVGMITNATGSVFFGANDGATGLEPWRSDGTAAGTFILGDFAPGTAASAPLSGPFPNGVAIGGIFYFAATDPTTGHELWKTDGTSAGTVMVKDIRTGVNGSFPTSLTSVNGTLFFSANDGIVGGELWQSDGTADGTILVKDIRPGPSGSLPFWLTNFDGMLLFSADDGTTGNELWKSDGTPGGTSLVKDIFPGSASSSLYLPTNVNGTLFFVADNGTSGGELWRTDATGSGTQLVKDISPGGGSSWPYDLVDVNGILFFGAETLTSGGELWKSSGTASGTELVKDIFPGADSSWPGWMTNVNGTVFFGAEDGTNGFELWKSDGTAAGTTLVKNIEPSADGSVPERLTNVNGTLFFTANDRTNGTELWKSDGTASGTLLVKDISPGPPGSSPGSLTRVGGKLFFTATSAAGTELWLSGGSGADTLVVSDLNPGGASSRPIILATANDRLLFRATNGMTGSELWTLRLNPTLSDIANVTINEDVATGPIAFTVADIDDPMSGWNLSASSSNTTLFPNANLVFGGSGNDRLITGTPALNQFGSATITVTFTSRPGSFVTDTFMVTVNAVNDAPTISGVEDQSVASGTPFIGPLAVTIGDAETSLSALFFTGSSSNQSVIPNSDVVLGGSGANRTVTLRLPPSAAGTTLITLTVSDGSAQAIRAFTATISEAPPPPPPPGPTPVLPSGAPSGLTALVRDSFIDLNWTAAPPSDQQQGEADAPGGYRIEVGTATGLSNAATYTTGVTTTFTVGSLLPGTYYMRVRAFNDGGTSNPSNEVVATIVAPTGLPGAPQNFQGTVTGHSVQLSWQAPSGTVAVVGYSVEVGSAPGLADFSVMPTTDLSLNMSGVPDGVYFVRVKALSTAGAGPASNEVTVVVSSTLAPCTLPPGAPGSLTGTVTGTRVQLSWLSPTSGDLPVGYVILVGSAPGLSNLASVTVDGAVTTFSAPAPDGTFFIRVIAVNACSSGAASNEITITVGVPPPPTPGAPTNLTAEVAGSQVTLNWALPITGGPVARYIIVVTDLAGNPIVTIDTGNASTTFGHNGALRGVYVVSVRAANAGGIGPASASVTVTVVP